MKKEKEINEDARWIQMMRWTDLLSKTKNSPSNEEIVIQGLK